MRQVPETSNRQDWPRLVANTMREIIAALRTVQTLQDWAALPDYADDAAAASGGLPIGGRYRTGSVLKVRIT